MPKIEKIQKIWYTHYMQIFYTWNIQDSNLFLKQILQNYFHITEYILKQNIYGKKYILLPNDTTPIHFSITHSKCLLAIAFFMDIVGVDTEYINKKIPVSILRLLTEQEKKECTSNYNFFKNWTAKESFIKLHGKSILEDFKHISYSNKKLLYYGESMLCHFQFIKIKNIDDIYILAICTMQEINSIKLIEIKK